MTPKFSSPYAHSPFRPGIYSAPPTDQGMPAGTEEAPGPNPRLPERLAASGGARANARRVAPVTEIQPRPVSVEKAALGAASLVSAAAVTAEGTIVAAAVATHVGGLVIVIASPLGLLAAGAPLALMMYLVTRRR
jgi:hypothetical protein